MYQTAVAAGIGPSEFWDLTPYLTRLAVGALHNEQITRSWTLAALMRAKKFPKLDTLLYKRPLSTEETTSKLKNLFARHNERMKAKKHG